MAESLPNLNTPSAAPSTPSSPKGPDLSTDVRSEVMGGLEGAIEVTSSQASGQGDDSAAAPVKKDPKSDAQTADDIIAAAAKSVHDIPEDTLLRLTRKKIQSQLAALDMTAQKILRTKSKSQAFNLTRVVSEMRRLHVSLQMLYRMAIERMRELYTQMK